MERYWELKGPLPNEENQRVVNEFLSHLKLSNRSKRTISRYKRLLEQFFGNMENTFTAITPEQIFLWFKEHKSHLKDSSYKGELSILSSLYSFCIQEGVVERSPIKRRWFPRLPKTIPKYLTKGEVSKLKTTSERASLRDRAIIEFMLTSGCRKAEVYLLNIGDVNLESRTARVLGKGRKIRTVHFSEHCTVLLERYLENHPGRNNGASPLFVNRWKGTRLSMNGITMMISRIGKKAGLPSNLHAHRFRHTFATELLAKGAELSFISDELGHADLRTTQIYARLPTQTIISQYRKFMG